MKIESLDLRGGCLVDGGVTLTWYVDCDGNDPEEFKRAHWPVGVWYHRRPNDLVWILAEELQSRVHNQQHRTVIRSVINQERVTEETTSLRDMVYTARGFLLKGIKYAHASRRKEIKAWDIFHRTLSSMDVKEDIVLSLIHI